MYWMLLGAAAAASPVVDHALDVSVDIKGHRIDVVDVVTLDKERDTVELVLHAGMKPTVDGAAAVVVDPLPPGGAVPTELVRASFAVPTKKLTIRYGGVIVHPPQQLASEHQRSFQETPGTIADEGVYLSSPAHWYPRVQHLDELVTMKLKVKGLPAGWRALSEGDAAGPDSWITTSPIDDLHLIAGPFTEIKERKRGVDVLIWMRTGAADIPSVAQRYLEVTGQYLAMYSDLIGPYPYGKFALVENFWETGYGMPSFTLLGPQVVRFPFILHSSWPHELLHNWWGNGVFVEGGNWCEGLTAYLADHMVNEQNGRGDEYRRTTLQKYEDFVAADPARDFPLAAFGNRFSAASEAVGYGKWLMVVHMTRKRLGDEAFRQALQRLWKEHKFERASFDDVRAAFQASAPAGEDLAPFFDAWIQRTGAPRIRWTEARAERTKGGGHRIVVALEQTQASDAFPVDVPVVVTTVDKRVVRGTVPMRDAAGKGARSARVTLELPAAPARLDIDPFADTMRALLPGETAPSLSKSLGAPKQIFVLPTLALDAERDAWKTFAAGICKTCPVVNDKELGDIPADAALWILGYGNQLRGAAVASAKKYGAHLDDHGFLSPGPYNRERLKSERTDPGKTSLVLALKHPRNPTGGAAFVGAHANVAIPLLARKVPHYGKYGYLTFAGDAAENQLKGQWQPDDNPLTVHFAPEKLASAAKPDAALAKLPPPFDPDRMLAIVQQLSAMNGRERPKDVDAALALVEKELAAAGAAGKRECVDGVGSGKDGKDGKDKQCNLIATIPGRNRALPAVVLGAHVDHLGKVKGKVHPGADDNASGVAVLVETARALAKAAPFERDVVLAVFTGEEAGLLGSKAYVKSLGADAAAVQAKVHSMVNLDSVGRRPADKAFLVHDGDSATEWVHVFRGVGFTTGVKAELAKEGGGGSDQRAFIEAGVPAIQLFSGLHPDWHRHTDTPDKIEGRSLVDAAVVTREVIAYLADRKEPLTTSATRSAGGGGGGGAGRRASLGTMPDMAFDGPGVRIEDVVAGSPAAAIGLQKGDVLMKFDGAAVADLRGYSELLKAKKPGDKVALVIVRAGKELSFDVVLTERSQ